MSRDYTIEELEYLESVAGMYSVNHDLMRGAAGETMVTAGDFADILRAFKACKAVTKLCCEKRTAPPEARYIEAGVLHRRRNGEVDFHQTPEVIELPVHGTLTVYMLEPSEPQRDAGKKEE